MNLLVIHLVPVVSLRVNRPQEYMSPRDVLITGIGIVTSLGEGAAPHVAALDGAEPVVDRERFAPYAVHPFAPVEMDRHIPKKSDQRQMESWQRHGTWAAGAALEDAGLKGNAEALQKMHLIVACGGGERDYAVDGAILTGMKTAADPGVYLNERLMSDIRPTLFLAQLSNLLAGNISIVHGVIGGSRTFMGEEQAGVDAIRIAEARIRSGQNDVFLVGGASNAERPDLILVYETGGFIWRDPSVKVADRKGGGFAPGSVSVFLVVESRAHAEARGAKAYAKLGPVAADRHRRSPGSVGKLLSQMLAQAGPANTVISGATGAAATGEELSSISAAVPKADVVMSGDLIGHGIEAQFPFGVALAAAGLGAGRLKNAAIVTSVGHARGEGLVRIEAP
jgi:3-oxoacyl-[acyl-carrier-protein] synthase II